MHVFIVIGLPHARPWPPSYETIVVLPLKPVGWPPPAVTTPHRAPLLRPNAMRPAAARHLLGCVLLPLRRACPLPLHVRAACHRLPCTSFRVVRCLLPCVDFCARPPLPCVVVALSPVQLWYMCCCPREPLLAPSSCWRRSRSPHTAFSPMLAGEAHHVGFQHFEFSCSTFYVVRFNISNLFVEC